MSVGELTDDGLGSLRLQFHLPASKPSVLRSANSTSARSRQVEVIILTHPVPVHSDENLIRGIPESR